jgi:hypothetical protein
MSAAACEKRAVWSGCHVPFGAVLAIASPQTAPNLELFSVAIRKEITLFLKKTLIFCFVNSSASSLANRMRRTPSTLAPCSIPTNA